MTIICNGESLELGQGTVADLLALQYGDPRPHGVAVAVNGEVVPRGDWTRSAVVDGDVVEVVTAVQGG